MAQVRRSRLPRRLIQLYVGLVTFAFGEALIPMREKPGLGTVSNVIVIGASLDLFLHWVPAPTSIGWRVALLLLGIAINGVGTVLFVLTIGLIVHVFLPRLTVGGPVTDH